MDVRIEPVSEVEKKLVVEVPWDTVSAKLRNAYRDLARGVSLKGFRKGKVPRSVLERMFGKRVHAEVATQLVRESFISAATEHQLDAVSEPQLDLDKFSIKKGQPFAFEAIVEVRGEIEAKDYDGMELTRRPLDVTEEAVDNALESLRREQTELMPIEDRKNTAPTDLLMVSVKGKLGEHDIDRPQITVDLEQPDREPLPGLVAALTGIPLDTTEAGIELKVPDDYPDEDIKGKTAELTVSIIDARQKDVPELDDELAKDLGRGENLDELRQSVRKELEEHQQEQIDSELRDAALRELVKRNQIPVAKSLVERAIQMQHERLKMMLGMTAEQGDNPAFALDDEMREKMRPQALDEVRGQLLLDAVAKQESIEVSDDDLSDRVGDMAAARKVPAARLRAELDRDGRLDNIRFQLLQDKTLDLLVSRATVTEKDPADAAKEAEEAAAAESADAELADAESADAGSADAESTDAGSADAGSADAGSADAGSADAESADAGAENTEAESAETASEEQKDE